MMKETAPNFGMLGGISFSITVMPIVVLLFLGCVVPGRLPKTIDWMIVCVFLNRVGAFWLYSRFFYSRMDDLKGMKSWRKRVSNPVYKHPNCVVALMALFVDAVCEGQLVTVALKSAVSPVWVLLTLLVCQAIAAPIQGFISDIRSQKRSLIFALLIGILSLALISQEFIDAFFIKELSVLLPALKIASAATSARILCVMAIKGLVGNIFPVAMGAVGAVVYSQTQKKQRT